MIFNDGDMAVAVAYLTFGDYVRFCGAVAVAGAYEDGR